MAITSASADLTTKLAPFNPTDTAAIKEVVRLANFSPSDVLYDLGCGDGRVLIYAATSTPLKRAVGVEYDKTYADRAKVAVKEAGLEERVTIFHGDAMTHDISDATVVFVYLVPSGLKLIQSTLHNFLRQTRPCRILSNIFSIPGLEPTAVFEYSSAKLKLYMYDRPPPPC